MKLKKKGMWLVSIAIWVGVIGLSVYNQTGIKKINELIKKKQISDSYLRFTKANLDNIAEALKMKELYCDSVTNSKLATSFFVGKLEEHAKKHSFSDIDIKISNTKNNSRGRNKGDQIADISFAFTGSLQETVKCLDVLRNDYLNTRIKKVTVSIDQQKKLVKFNISMDYKHKIIKPDGLNTVSVEPEQMEGGIL